MVLDQSLVASVQSPHNAVTISGRYTESGVESYRRVYSSLHFQYVSLSIVCYVLYTVVVSGWGVMGDV